MEQKTAGRRPPVALKQAIEKVHEFGCVVKDLDIGLIDFPTLFQGEEVYLCWKLGEAGIRFWHGVNEGFRGRKPIDAGFSNIIGASCLTECARIGESSRGHASRSRLVKSHASE